MSDTPGRFDITRVRLRHYRSIASCNVRLGNLALVVGPNGSGKSNFVDSLRLVSQALNENLDNALRERGGVTEVRRRSTGHPTHFGIELTFTGEGFGGEFKFQVAAVKGGDYRVSHESCRVRRTDLGAEDSYYEIRDGTVVESSEGWSPPRVTNDRLFLVALSGLEEFRPVFDGLAGVNVYSLNPDLMRVLQKPDTGDLMNRDGSNVASVLENLRRTTPDLKLRIEEYLRQIVPGVESVDRKGLGAWESLEFRQRVAGSQDPWQFPATSMSDGTLRALGVLVALFAQTDSGRSAVAIEEPEAALHPAAAGLLLAALKSASSLRQVLATTHSPDLLDSPTIRPEDVIAVRSLGGNTQVADLDVAGQFAIRESLYTAGELLRVDQLIPADVGSSQTELFS